MLRLILPSTILALAMGASTLASSPSDARSSAMSDFALPDAAGKKHALSDYEESELVVVAFLGVDCPLAKLYAARLQELSSQYAPKQVQFLAVMSNVQDSLSEIAAYARKHKLTMPVMKDRANQVADQFDAKRTPEVFLLDRNRRVRYQGRVDDQHLIGVKRDAPKREDLRIAIDQLLAGKEVSQSQADAIGCLIGRRREANPESKVTYTRDIAPILARRCVECHREGDIGPFELTSYEEASGWGDMMLEVVRERRMPPWHANPKHGEFVNNRSMPKEEIAALETWVKNGCPQGDPADLPPAREFTPGWQLPRKPDQVWAMSDKPFVVPADGGPAGVPYQYLRVPSGFEKHTWIKAAEVQPGNREVVHHIIVYAEPPHSHRRRDWIFLTAYVPGLRFDPLPERSAMRIPAGSKFIFEMHYTPVGSQQHDISQLGVLFADADDIQHEVMTNEVGNVSFKIPPHADAHVVTATSQPTKREVTLLSMSPHMHLRGKAFRYDLVLKDGSREVLLDVPAYDFNWQTKYQLKTPRRLPIGSIIHCRAVFDNSENNPANPDPTKQVRWGDQSWDEMMLGYMTVMLPYEGAASAGKPVKTGWDLVGKFDAADTDQTRGLSPAEVKGHELLEPHFKRVDQNQDGQLQLGEIIAAVRAMGRG